MKRLFATLYTLLLISLPGFAQWQVQGGAYPVYEYNPSSGVNAVFVIYGNENISLQYSLEQAQPAECYVYGSDGAVSTASYFQQDNILTFESVHTSAGYYIEQNGVRLTCIWLINYLDVPVRLTSLAVDGEKSDCDYTYLTLNRTAPDMLYYTPEGVAGAIRRTYTVDYNSLSWNDSSLSFDQSDESVSVADGAVIKVAASYSPTTFFLKGDQFLSFWGMAQTLTSDYYQGRAVTGKAFATQSLRESGNELDKQSGELGGSAPVEVEFTGYANYPVTTYQAWEISSKSDFSDLIATYPTQNLSYTFENEGTTYVRFLVSNADASCESQVATFTVNTSESSLQVPNLFTPDSPSGSNRIFKVAYRSIIKFEGWVYNRWGNEVFHWSDPSQGWDGTFHGRQVPTGAYFYVIRAEGVGGKKYNLKGDINILNTKK